MIKVGLLGAGRIGQVHAVNIATHPDSSLSAISDINKSAAEDLSARYGANIASSEDIIADKSIDAVLIATSTDTHADLIEAANAAGKAVLCEKPVDLDLDRARACQSAIAGSGRSVMMGFNRRFDTNFQALKNTLDVGEIGKPELLTIISHDPAPPPIEYVKVSGGLFRDMMIHDFDIANFIMGDVPKSISAVGSSLVNPEIAAAGDVDTAVVTMTYSDGRIAVIKNSRRAAYGYDQRIELLGSKGLLQAENVLESSLTKSTEDGVTSAKPMYFFLERYMAAYAAEWAEFVNAVTNNQPFPVTLEDGVKALAMAEAAAQSVTSGGPVAIQSV